MKSEIRLVREYPHPRVRVWKALTEPKIMALWGMRPEGFAPVVGTRFTLLGTPNPAWRGYVECEVTDVIDLELIGYAWVDNHGAKTTHLRFALEDAPKGTRLLVTHTGFTGVGGLVFSKFIMGPGLRKTVDARLPVVLKDLCDDGTLRPGSSLHSTY